VRYYTHLYGPPEENLRLGDAVTILAHEGSGARGVLLAGLPAEPGNHVVNAFNVNNVIYLVDVPKRALGRRMVVGQGEFDGDYRTESIKLFVTTRTGGGPDPGLGAVPSLGGDIGAVAAVGGPASRPVDLDQIGERLSSTGPR
jgi:hypothetical protein